MGKKARRCGDSVPPTHRSTDVVEQPCGPEGGQRLTDQVGHKLDFLRCDPNVAVMRDDAARVRIPVEGESRCRCGRGAPSRGADVAVGMSAVLAQMWRGCAQSQCKCGKGATSSCADVAGVSPVPEQMWWGCAQSQSRARLAECSGDRICACAITRSRAEWHWGGWAGQVGPGRGLTQSGG